MKQILNNFAALISPSDIGFKGPTSDAGIIHNILLTMYFWGGVLAVVVIIIAGFLYVTSNGNAQQVTRAKNAIIGSVVGLVVILTAFSITNIVLGAVK